MCDDIRQAFGRCGCGGCSPPPARPLPKIVDQRTTFSTIDIPSLGFIVTEACDEPSAYHGFAAEIGRISTGFFQRGASGCCSRDCKALVEITRLYWEAHPELIADYGAWPDGQRDLAACLKSNCENAGISKPSVQPSTPPRTPAGEVSEQTVTVEYSPEPDFETYGEDPFRQYPGGNTLDLRNTLELPPAGADLPPIQQPGLYPNQGVSAYLNQA